MWEECLWFGCDDFVAKPIEWPRLTCLIASYARRDRGAVILRRPVPPFPGKQIRLESPACVRIFHAGVRWMAPEHPLADGGNRYARKAPCS
jgi:hypothetical protein